MRIHASIALGFERWAVTMVRHRGLAMSTILLLTLGLGLQIPKLRLDNSVEAFLHEDDPALIDFNAFRDQFGRDDISVIGIEAPEIFDLGFFENLRSLQADLEHEVPHLDEVTSLANARSTRGERDQLIVEDLMQHWPQGPSDLESLRERVFADPAYRNLLISQDGHMTTVLVKPVPYSGSESERQALEGFDEAKPGTAATRGSPRPLTEEESAAVVQAIRRVVARHQSQDFKLHLSGAAVMEERLVDAMESDITRFMSLSTGIILVVLYLVFRSALGVILPLITVMLSLVSTLGVMALLEIPISLTTEVAPPFLLTVGICDSVHILVLVFQQLREGAQREQAIRHALGHSGLAVVMTSLTTAAGLVSFIWAEVRPVSELGIVTPIGVLLAMTYTLVLLPALLAWIAPREVRMSRRSVNLGLVRFLVGCGRLCGSHPRTVLLVWGVVLCTIGLGIRGLRFSHNELFWLPEESPLRVASDLIDRKMRGTLTLEAVIDTGRKDALLEPAWLHRIDQVAQINGSIRQGDLFIGKTISLVDIVKETHQALNENRPEFYAIPDSREAVAQELLLFQNSGSDDLEELVDSDFRKARLSLKVPWTDWILYPQFLATMHQQLRKTLGADVGITLTGVIALLARAASTMVFTMGRSYAIALAIITPLMMLLLGSFRRGMLSMLPNLTPIVFILGVMGWLDIPLDMSTLLIGGIVIGLAVDDTIHFMHRFNGYHAEGCNAPEAVRRTLETTGTAMLFTSIVLAAGFFVFMGAYTSSIAAFGLLTGLAVVVAFAADVTVSPALMILVTRGEDRSRRAEFLSQASSPPLSHGTDQTQGQMNRRSEHTNQTARDRSRSGRA